MFLFSINSTTAGIAYEPLLYTVHLCLSSVMSLQIKDATFRLLCPFNWSLNLILIFFLDKKETKNQEITMLSTHMSNPRPPFFLACALFWSFLYFKTLLKKTTWLSHHFFITCEGFVFRNQVFSKLLPRKFNGSFQSLFFPFLVWCTTFTAMCSTGFKSTHFIA